MNSTAIMFPILPDKRDVLFEFAGALNGERGEEYAASQESVTEETWYLQSTPAGDFLIVHFKAPDIASVFSAMATSQTPFDTWFRQKAHEITGIDLGKPLGELPGVIFEFRRN